MSMRYFALKRKAHVTTTVPLTGTLKHFACTLRVIADAGLVDGVRHSIDVVT